MVLLVLIQDSWLSVMQANDYKAHSSHGKSSICLPERADKDHLPCRSFVGTSQETDAVSDGLYRVGLTSEAHVHARYDRAMV